MKTAKSFFYSLTFVSLLLSTSSFSSAGYQSAWRQMPDRIWTGQDTWANPWERWSILSGKLACIEPSPGLNVQHLFCQVSDQPGTLTTSVTLSFAPQYSQKPGSAGFKLGIRLDDPMDDYRSRLLCRAGIMAGIATDGKIFIGKQESAPNPKLLAAIRAGSPILLTGNLTDLPGDPTQTSLQLSVSIDDKTIETITQSLPATQLSGNLGLFCEYPQRFLDRSGVLFFDQWTLSGSRLTTQPNQSFGPILWSSYTLDRQVMKMTAQMPPLGTDDSQSVTLQILQAGQWQEIDRQSIEPDSLTALFRIANWDDSRDHAYRLHWLEKRTDGSQTNHYYSGTIRRNPTDRNPLVVAGLVCFTDPLFPYRNLVQNLTHQDPDLLVFLGDQIYEENGGFGVMRKGDFDQMYANYLRKVSLLMWSCRDLMAGRPTVVMPDDHDMYQGNLWGANGRQITLQEWSRPSGYGNSPVVGSIGGFVQPARWVNAVQRSQTAHLPDPYDPTPVEQGISVYYTDLFYGGVSFAILEDRKFKAGPMSIDLKHSGPRPDHIANPVDAQTVNDPDAWLYGPRQLKFVKDWIANRQPQAMKIILSQTIPCNAATHHGSYENYLFADMDSNGWPQAGRNRFLEALGGKAFILAGDQHLTTIIRQGIHAFDDSVYSFCVPAGCTGYQRWWRPDETPHQRDGGLIDNRPNTGRYHDGFGNLMTVIAVGNPPKPDKADTIEARGIQKASGWGIVRLDKSARTVTMESWRYGCDVTHPQPASQFEGWPMTIPLP